MLQLPFIYHSLRNVETGAQLWVPLGWRFARRALARGRRWLGAMLVISVISGGVLASLPAQAQVRSAVVTDSLLRRLPLVTDTTKVLLLLELCKQYTDNQPAPAERCGTEALALAEQLHWPRGAALALERLCVLHASKQNYSQAQVEIMRALALWEKQKNKQKIYNTMYYISALLSQAGEYRRADEMVRKVSLMAEEQHDTLRIVWSYNQLGAIASYLGNWVESVRWFKRVLPLAQQQHNQDFTARALNNLADSYIRLNKPQLALQYLFRALPLAQAMGQKQSISITLVTIAQAYLKLRQPAKGLPYALEGYRLASEIHANEEVAEIDGVLMDLYVALGQYQPAYTYAKHQADLQRELFSSAKARSFAELQTRYETQEKEQQIKLLTQRNQIQELAAAQQRTVRNAALLSSGLLLLAVGLVYSRYQLRQRTVRQLNAQARILEKQDQEKSLLLREVHHRVKNNLQIVLSLLHSQLRTLREPAAISAIRESQSRLQTMALIHQNLYQTDSLARIDMARYLAELVAAIQQTFRREAAPVHVTVAVAPLHLNTHTAVPLGLVVNELVTNALKYAFPHQADKQLLIQLETVGPADFCLTVADNGVGLPPLDPERLESLGLRLVLGLLEQIGATLTIHRAGGTRLAIAFREVMLDEPMPAGQAYQEAERYV